MALFFYEPIKGDDPDSYTWRLPPLDPRANPLMDDLRRERERQAKHDAEREAARRAAMEEWRKVEEAVACFDGRAHGQRIMYMTSNKIGNMGDSRLFDPPLPWREDSPTKS